MPATPNPSHPLVRRLVRQDLPREPWRNGLGWTSLVASGQTGAEPAWRVSIAEVLGATAFSQFPQMDRTAVLIQGGPLQLTGAQQCWSLGVRGDMARFAGEADVCSEQPLNAALLWNVFCHRRHARVQVAIHTQRELALDDDGQTLMWALQGHFLFESPTGSRTRLAPDEGLHCLGRMPGARLWSLEAEAKLLCTRVWHLIAT